MKLAASSEFLSSVTYYLRYIQLVNNDRDNCLKGEEKGTRYPSECHH